MPPRVKLRIEREVVVDGGAEEFVNELLDEEARKGRKAERERQTKKKRGKEGLGEEEKEEKVKKREKEKKETQQMVAIINSEV